MWHCKRADSLFFGTLTATLTTGSAILRKVYGFARIENAPLRDSQPCGESLQHIYQHEVLYAQRKLRQED